MKKLAAILLSAALLTGASAVPARAASYPDLDAAHWAYADMDKARGMGILSGLPDGTMRPGATLTWGEYLTMVGRAFYPETYASVPADPAEYWAVPAYTAAMEAGVLQPADFLPVSPATLSAPITRQDTAVLLDRAMRQAGELTLAQADGGLVFSDFSSLPEPYRAGVLQCYERGVVKGYEDGSFGGGGTLTRADGSVLLMRALSACEGKVSVSAPPEGIPTVSAPGDHAEPPAVDSPAPSGGQSAAQVGYDSADDALRALGCNDSKLIRLYGTAEQTRYPDRETAEEHMVSVTVPVWRLNVETGVKTASNCTFRANAAIADELVEIFTEIYEDPEQFPIYEIGGYSWRGDTAKGEHNCGTAIDLNANENYQVYADGSVGAGDHWTPGEDPFSIPEDGSVVRIFNAHGFSWGGNAWPTNQDYMHFSYLGV